MNLFDESDLLLDYMNNVFMTSDDCGTCEAILPEMTSNPRVDGFVLPCQDSQVTLNERSISPDIKADRGHRNRSNTALLLDRLQENKEQTIVCTTVSWKATNENNIDVDDFFPRVPVVRPKKYQSLATKMIRDNPQVQQNPFIQFAIFESSNNSKMFSIFLPELLDEAKRDIPMRVSISATGTVNDLLGLVAYKYTSEGRQPPIKKHSDHGLFMAEECGEVEVDLPSLNVQESIARIGFTYLALVSLSPSDILPTVIVYFTSGEEYNMQLVCKEETLAQIRDRTLLIRSKNNFKDYSMYDYNRAESAGRPFITFDLNKRVLSTQCNAFVFIRKNNTRGDFDPLRKVSAVSESGSSKEELLTPMCLFYSVKLKVASRGFVQAQLVVCADHMEVSVTSTPLATSKTSFSFSSLARKTSKRDSHTSTSISIPINSVGGISVLSENDGVKFFRLVHLGESNQEKGSYKYRQKIKWTSHNLEAPSRSVDQICSHVHKLLDGRPSKARSLFVNRDRSEFSPRPSILKRMASFSTRRRDFTQSFSEETSSDSLRGAYQIEGDWME